MPPIFCGFCSFMPSPRPLISAAFCLGCTAISSAQTPSLHVAASTLRMPSDGTTSAYKATPSFGGLFFEHPVQVVYAPGETQRAFVVERPGRVSVVRDTTNPTRDVFLDLTSKTETTNGGLLSLAF